MSVVNSKQLGKIIQEQSSLNINGLSISLKKNRDKGWGVFANKSIKKGQLVAYYKMKVFDVNKYSSPTNNLYTFEVVDKKGKVLDELVGDLYQDSFQNPYRSIPFWGPFMNEPSGKQTPNIKIDTNIIYNYKNRDTLQPGDIIIYKFMASRTIKTGEELTWCYGKSYSEKSNYETNCKI